MEVNLITTDKELREFRNKIQFVWFTGLFNAVSHTNIESHNSTRLNCNMAW